MHRNNLRQGAIHVLSGELQRLLKVWECCINSFWCVNGATLMMPEGKPENLALAVLAERVRRISMQTQWLCPEPSLPPAVLDMLCNENFWQHEKIVWK